MSGSRRSYSRSVFALVAVALVAVALVATGSSAASAKPTHTLVTSGSSAANATHTIRFRVVNATNLELRVASDHFLYFGGRWREKPSDTDPYSIADYTAESTTGEVAADTYYRIGNTPYYLYVLAANPLIGTNRTDCNIQLENHSVPGDAPYTCDHNTGRGFDMNATFVVQPRTGRTYDLTPDSGLTGGLSQRDVVQSFCIPNQPPAYVGCDVAAHADVKNVTIVAGPERIVSDVLINCSSFSADKTISSANTVTETNTIGVTSDVTYKLSDTVTPKLAVNYQHQWTHTVTTTDTTKVTAGPGEYLYMTQAAWMQEVTATWTIKAGNQTFVATDLTLLRPSVGVRTNIVVAHSAPVPTGFCAGKPTTPFFEAKPLTPAASGVYTIRPNSANGRSISVAGRSHGNAVPLQLAGVNNSDRSQQWVFYEVPKYPGYFQIRNGYTLSMCMDLNGVDWRTIQQYYCKGPDNPTIANQLWTIEYDPSTNSLEVVSMQMVKDQGRSLALANSDFRIGDPVIGLANPQVKVGRWLFYSL